MQSENATLVKFTTIQNGLGSNFLWSKTIPTSSENESGGWTAELERHIGPGLDMLLLWRDC